MLSPNCREFKSSSRFNKAFSLALVAGVLCFPVRLFAAQQEDTGDFQGANEQDPFDMNEDAEELISMEFLDVTLKEILKAFSMKTGLNVIISGEIGDDLMTLYLEDVTVLDALDQILLAGNLTYDRQAGSDIIVVKARPEEGKPELITRVYRLRFARVSTSVLGKAAAAFGASTPFEGSSDSDESGGGGGGSGGDSVGIDVVLESLLSEYGSITVDERTNTIIVTDIAENFPRIEATFSVLDIKTPQILVDAEILETSLTIGEDLGISWTGGGEEDGEWFNFTPAQRTTRFPFQNNFWKSNSEMAGLSDDSLTLTAGLFDLSPAKVVLQAIRSDDSTKILARPKILTLDNESAVIRLSTNAAVGTTVETTDTGTTENILRETTGIVLVVTPQVNDDGFITMIIEPMFAEPILSSVKTSTGGDILDPKVRKARSIVRVQNGDTIVLGGLIDRKEKETVKSVPFLSDVPIIGKAFKRSDVNDVSTELITFITPYILDDSRGLASFATPDMMRNEVIRNLPYSPNLPREQEGPNDREGVIEATMSNF